MFSNFKRITTIISCNLLLLFCSPTSAGEYFGNSTITTIRVGTDVYVGIDPQPTNTCSHWGEHVWFDPTTVLGKTLLAGLLAAQAANKTINLWYTASTAPGTDQSTGCSTIAMAILTRIRIKS